MSTRSAKKWLGVTVVWLMVFGGISLAWRHIYNGNDETNSMVGTTSSVAEKTKPAVPETKPPTSTGSITRITIRFSSGTDKIMSYSMRDLDDLAGKLAGDPNLTLRIVGHISPGSYPDDEKRLTERQIRKLKSFFCEDRGISYSRVATATTNESNENGTYGVATCEIRKVNK